LSIIELLCNNSNAGLMQCQEMTFLLFDTCMLNFASLYEKYILMKL
jgi:hypothetical protein